MPTSAPDALASSVLGRLSQTLGDLINPADLFSGAKLEETFFADNIVVFKRTATAMLKPHGVTHNYHPRFEWVVPLVKSGRIHVDGQGYLLKPGQSYLIFPHQFHHYLEIEEGPMSWLFITFQCRQAQALAPLRNSPRILGAGDAEALNGLIRRHVAMPPGAERNFALIFEFSQLIRRLIGSREADRAPRAADRQDPQGSILASINAYVRSHLSKSITLADLAKPTGYSVSYLRAVFRREYGVSLGAYMRESRLSIAASMLAEGRGDNIGAVAKACGFDSIFAFGRAFKKNDRPFAPRLPQVFPSQAGEAMIAVFAAAG